jgi:hypothetical protein
MFASILNYTDCKAEDSDGIDNLKSLNSIITEFDQIVTHFFHISMVACPFDVDAVRFRRFLATALQTAANRIDVEYSIQTPGLPLLGNVFREPIILIKK